MRAIKVICAAAALTAFLAPNAHADEWNKRTYLTFSGPVEIPGATLKAGTYTFELADPDNARHVIRVSEKDTNKPIALLMTIPNQRLQARDDTLIMCAERPAGARQAIQAWFYPGNRTGEEFVYPKSQAMKIARANKRAVLATADNSSSRSESDRMAAMRGAEVGRVDENGNMSKDSESTPTTTARSESTPSTTAAPANTATGRNAASTTTAKADTAPRSHTAVGTS